MSNTNQVMAKDKVIRGLFSEAPEQSIETAMPSQSVQMPQEEFSSELSVLDQLNANLFQLEDLHGRLKFMMREVSSLIKS